MDVIPLARDTDVEDVAWALQTAEALWRRDERIDAIVWLRRAAQAAGEANDDDRALMLARHAAELSEWLANNQGEEPPRPSGAPTAVVEASKSSLGPLDELMAQPQSIPADAALPAFAIESERPPPVADPPSAEQMHAGILDPWSEGARPADRREQRVQAKVAELPQINVPLSGPSLSKPDFEEEEVVTSANFVNAQPSEPEPENAPPPLPKRPAPPRAPALRAPEDEDSDVALEGMGMAAALKEVRDSQRAPHLPQGEPASPSPPAVRAKPPIPKPAAPKPPLPKPPLPKVAPPKPPVRAEAEVPAPVEAAPPPIAKEPEIQAPSPPPPIEPAPVVEEKMAAPPIVETAPAAVAPPDDGKLHLDDVDAFADLPDDARDAFAAAATLSTLGHDEEVSGFALAYVISGEVDVAATIVDAPAERLHQGAVLRTRGTIGEGMALRLIGVQGGARVAVWDPEAVEAAFKTCPWVEDDLRTAADRMQALVGITMGTIAERLDPSLRQAFTERLEARTLPPGGVLVEKGAPIPGLMLVGVGTIEIVDGDAVQGEITPGDFVFATEILGGGKAHATARAGAEGAVYLFADRKVAQELLVTCPPLLEIFAGM